MLIRLDATLDEPSCSTFWKSMLPTITAGFDGGRHVVGFDGGGGTVGLGDGGAAVGFNGWRMHCCLRLVEEALLGVWRVSLTISISGRLWILHCVFREGKRKNMIFL